MVSKLPPEATRLDQVWLDRAIEWACNGVSFAKHWDLPSDLVEALDAVVVSGGDPDKVAVLRRVGQSHLGEVCLFEPHWRSKTKPTDFSTLRFVDCWGDDIA
jgi:hypothetical protein